MAGVFAALFSVQYFGNHLSTSIDQYVQYVDAQDDLLIAQVPDAEIDETGSLARVDFYSWYDLDDLDTLDTEYAQVREIYGLTSLEEKAFECPEGAVATTEANKNWDTQDFKCYSRFNRPNGYVEEYLNTN